MHWLKVKVLAELVPPRGSEEGIGFLAFCSFSGLPFFQPPIPGTAAVSGTFFFSVDSLYWQVLRTQNSSKSRRMGKEAGHGSPPPREDPGKPGQWGGALATSSPAPSGEQAPMQENASQHRGREQNPGRCLSPIFRAHYPGLHLHLTSPSLAPASPRLLLRTLVITLGPSG